MQSPCKRKQTTRRTAKLNRMSETPPALVPITPYGVNRNRSRNDVISFAQKMAGAGNSPGDISPRTRRIRKRVSRCPTPQKQVKVPSASTLMHPLCPQYPREVIEEYLSLMFEWMCSSTESRSDGLARHPRRAST